MKKAKELMIVSLDSGKHLPRKKYKNKSGGHVIEKIDHKQFKTSDNQAFRKSNVSERVKHPNAKWLIWHWPKLNFVRIAMANTKPLFYQKVINSKTKSADDAAASSVCKYVYVCVCK